MKRLYFLLILAMSVTFAMAQNSRTLYDFENGTTQGWTAIDADGDGFSWGLHAPDATYTSDVGHDGSSYYFNSASYDNDSGTALSPNNFLVSPQVTLGGTISFWAQAQDPNYAAEHFGVAVSTTSATNASAFTTIQEWTMTAKSIPGIIGNHKTRSGNRTTNTWYQFTVDLSAYSGQGYVAIRHFNCTDQFILNVDDITIEAGSGGGPTPEGTITFEDQQIPSSWNNDATYPWVVASPTSYPGYHGSYCMMSGNTGVGNSTSSMEATVNFVQNGSISFLAGCWGEGSSDTYDWDKCRFYIDGELMFDYGAHQSWELMSYEVSAGSHTFTWTYKKDNSVNPTGDFFGVDDVTFVGAGSGGGGSESIIYDFENSTTQGWTTIDADGDGYTWVLGSAIGGIYLISGASLAGSGHNASNDLMCSGSYRNLDAGGGEVLTPDNYLVSPQVALGGSIDFWACGQDAGYAAEHFGVAVSTTNNTNPSAFTVLQQWTLTAKGTRYEGPRGNRDQGTWYHFTVDLSAYAGQTGYIAIRHFNCSDQFILDIDDITIVEGSGSSTPTYTITATPNPLEGGYITIAYRGERDRQSYDFEDGAQGWTSIDADGDGYGWDSHINTGTGNHTAHAGDGLMTSASYINDIGALTPDNYLVSPQVQLGGSITFYACAQDAGYAAEHFGVAVSTTSNTNASAFTTIQQWTMTAKSVGTPTNFNRMGGTRDSGAYYEYTVNLSAYAGQTGYVAIRHFDCTDQFYLNVDDITINEGGSGGQTGETVTGEFNEGQTCILTAIPFTGYHFVNWTENGTVVSTNAVYSFTVTGNRTLYANFSNESGQTYTITATPNPLEGGYITIDYRSNRDVVFSDDFETGISNWTLIDADGDGQNWYDLIDNNPNNIPGHNGSAGFATSASYSGSALTPDNYLVSPQVALNGTFSFWACAQDASWAAEHFGVAVSTTNNTSAAAFTTIQQWDLTAKSGSGVRTSDTRDGMTRDQGAWYQFTVDLSNYAGQMGYIAIRHFGCTDMFRIVVDDVELTTEGQAGGTVSGVFNEGQTCILSAFPFTGYHFVNWTENGTVVSTNSVYSFTVTCDRNLIANFSNDAGQTYTITATPNPLEGGYITIAYRSNRDVVFSDDFETGISNWTLIDADGDGQNWYDLIDDNPNNIPGHNGSAGFATSASYSGSALTPDNYLVSPQVALNGTFSFWACAQDASWAAEHFGVAVSTTNNTSAAAFTTIQQWDLTAKSGSGVRTSDTRDGMTRDQGAWYQFTVDLSNYAGQMGYIAIRHFGCTDMFRIVVDDVELTTEGQAGGTVSGTFEEGQTCILSAFPFSGYHFVNWTENGTVVSTESVYSFVVTCDRNLVANFSNEPVQTYTITATPNPLEGGYITIEYSGDREEFFYDFEDSTMQGWTTIDADGDGYNWELGSVLMAGYLIPSHGDGADCMSSQSYDSDAGALTPDNYLVSPQVQLGGSITFWACAQDESYAAEHFGVAVSTTSNTNASAFATLQEWTMTAKSAGNPGNYASRSRVGREGTWYEYTVDLSSYAGQTGYIAIRHFNCSDMFYLDVDDITIVEGAGGGGETGETVSAVFEEGQTCILTAIPFSGYYFVNWTENGTEVANTAVYSFTVTCDRNLVANFSQEPAESYTINAVADPTIGGTVTGAGTYAYGTEVTLGVTLNEGYIFEYWTEGGLIVSTDQDYTFTVTGNRDLVACLKLDDDGVGEHNITVAIYPNPVNDKLNVEATEAIEQVEVFNITGAKVFSKKNYTEKAEINTANLPAGTYVIRMTTKSASEVRSFVKF